MSINRITNKLFEKELVNSGQSSVSSNDSIEMFSSGSNSKNLASVEAKVDDLRKQKSTKQQEADTKQSSVGTIQGEVEGYRTEAESLQTNADSLKATAQEKQTAANNLKAQASQMAASLSSVPQTIPDKDGKNIQNPEYANIQAQVAQLQAQAAAAQSEADAAKNEADAAQSEADEAKNQADEKNQQLETLRTELETVNSELQGIIQQLESAEQELESAKQSGKNNAGMEKLNDKASDESEALSQIQAEEEKYSKEDFGTYDEWVQKLQAAGIKTTGLANGETNFAEYGAALSDELTQELVNSFDTPEDYELQQKLAGLYQNKSNMTTNEFIASCKAMGLDVGSDYVSTSYLVDAKATGGGKAGLNENGAIEVLTIKDPSTGAEIKIADTNGNGAIEVEELFMNELLTGISTTIDKSNFSAAVNGVSISSVSDARAKAAELAKEYESAVEKDQNGNVTDDKRNKISIEDKFKMIESLRKEYIAAGKDTLTASTLASRVVENNYVVSYDSDKMQQSDMQSAVSKMAKQK